MTKIMCMLFDIVKKHVLVYISHKPRQRNLDFDCYHRRILIKRTKKKNLSLSNFEMNLTVMVWSETKPHMQQFNHWTHSQGSEVTALSMTCTRATD